MSLAGELNCRLYCLFNETRNQQQHLSRHVYIFSPWYRNFMQLTASLDSLAGSVLQVTGENT